MRAYHGTGDADGIVAAGLDPDHEASWGADMEDLASLGGIYCAHDAGATVSYAERAMQEFGGYPAIIVLEVDEADMRADEDHLSGFLFDRVGRDAKEVSLDKAEHLALLMNRSRTPSAEQVDAAFAWANAALAMRNYSGEDPDVADRYREATNAACDLFPWTATLEFCAHWGQGAPSFRIMRRVGFDGPGTRILNVVDFDLEDNGLTLAAITGRFGDVDDDLKEELAEAWAELVEARTGMRADVSRALGAASPAFG